MRLLLVKRGSALPLYLRLVTDHLRLFTLYEQVSWGCKPNPDFLSPNPISHSPFSFFPSHPSTSLPSSFVIS